MTLPAVSVSQTPEEKFREYLASRPKPKRFTEPQREIVQFIFERHSHFNADQLCEEMKQAGFRVSRPTIYRTLAKLVDAGLLRSLETGPTKYYEHGYGYPQHYHLQCQTCNTMLEFENPTIEVIAREAARQHNFRVDSHVFVVQGTCAECNRAKMTRRRLDLI